jgi:predicted RND superfamily exporter protein
MRSRRPPILVIFFLSVFITIGMFYLISALINPVGDEGVIIVIGMVISMQISFLTAFIMNKSTHTKG